MTEPRTTAESRTTLLELLERVPDSLITFHRRPDGDALGSALGLAIWLEARGASVHVVCEDGVPDPFGFMPGVERVVRKAPADMSRLTVFILDTPDARRASVEDGALGAAERVINIDHHPDNPRYGDINLVDPTASSVALLVYELLSGLGGIDGQVARALYVGVMTDTGGFRFGNTDARTLRAAAELVELGASPAGLANSVYGEQPLGRLRLMGMILASTETLLDGRVAVSVLTREMKEETGSTGEDIEGIASFGRLVGGVEVALLLREEGDGIRASLRSKGRVDVNAIARRLGGGGHASAAGVVLDGPLADAKERLLSAVSETIDGRATGDNV